ncbi:TPA: recombinase family protein, partial [Salmonella enterica subsp. enterica serovar Kentucky]|nr:recombinase family protein [Salmonella enterica subsp. enterica serovar Kentucky]HCT1312668.1 recombinase family protein [Salmonella enterica subsp. enterica serovar Kentucky]
SVVTHLVDERRIGFLSLQEQIETNSASGKLVFHVFAALAEFERNLISERTKAGLEAARARGRLGGRKPKLQKKDIREIRALLKDGSIPVSDVARRYGVSRTTIYNHVGVVSVQNSRGD